MRHFEPLEPNAGLVHRVREFGRDTKLYCWGWGARRLDFKEGETVFGFNFQGSTLLIDHRTGLGYELAPGAYFSAPYGCAIESLELDDPAHIEARGIAIVIPGYRGMFMVGGPIEETGRLRYIDSCTDSLLIPPVKLGDPCLNHLHFPPGIVQTAHTHPSVRLGIVTQGRGRCWTPDAEVDLEPGKLWCINTGGHHRFETAGETLDVIAYHPDSDYGPQDEDHPMINRTLVDGISASKLTQIHTR